MFTFKLFSVTFFLLFLLQGFKPLCQVIKIDVIIVPRPALGRVSAQRSVAWHGGEVGQVEDIAASGGGSRRRGVIGHRRLFRRVVGGRAGSIVKTRVIDVRRMLLGPGSGGLRWDVVLERGRNSSSASSDVGILEGLCGRSCET